MSEHGSSVKVGDICHGMRNLTIVGRITQVHQVRTVVTKFGPARGATATLEDQTGWIRLNLWRDQIDKVRIGDTVRLENAFVRYSTTRTN